MPPLEALACPRQGDRVRVTDKNHRHYDRTGLVQGSITNGHSWWVAIELKDESIIVERFERPQLEVIPIVPPKVMVENIYRRYTAIRIQTIMDCLNVLTMCDDNSFAAKSIMEESILKILDKGLNPKDAAALREKIANAKISRFKITQARV
jgi:hypothetical protein